MASDELAPFLFEISSDLRLRILEALAERPLKHAEIARRLSMTGSEATRHLNRLVTAGLLVKAARGEYAPTPLAAALRAGLPFFEFLTKYRPYLLAHNALAVGAPFAARLGELRGGTLTRGMYDVVAVQEAAIRAARRRIWVITEQPFERALPMFREKVAAGTDVRIVRPRGAIHAERAAARPIERNYAVRLLDEVRFFLAVLDNTAGLCLPTPEGRIDMMDMLLLEDPEGCEWASDLFLRTWSRAREWRSPTGSTAPDQGRTN